uniref:MD-2-related lipid-recognition domain-containing protein n=1 Tax=Timema monikensis TaxID=170555 RepID=A0A7R9EIF5_9NEOP|nr:unnamed protein product [Timema monikensis]
MGFTTTTNTGSLPKSLTNDVYIMINNVHIGVTVQPNFCDYSGLCPLRATRLSYTSKITVTADVPPFNGHVHWSMFNEMNEPMVCYIFDIKVIEPSSSSLVEKIHLKMDNDSSSYHLRGNYPYH